jgi:hypothetical protein
MKSAKCCCSRLRCLLTVQLQRMGLPSVATGESVAPYLVGIPPTVQKQRELGLADSHHSVDDKTAQANNVEAAALGLRDYTDLMEWNGLGGAEMHSPARLGQDIEDVLRLRVGQTPPRRAVSFPEVCSGFIPYLYFPCTCSAKPASALSFEACWA